MSVYSLIMAATLIPAGPLLFWVGSKAGQGTLPKNHWVGLRTSALLESEDNWMKGHQAAANLLKASGLPPFIGGVACLFADDSLINWLSIPIVIGLVLLVLLATRKAHLAVQA